MKESVAHKGGRPDKRSNDTTVKTLSEMSITKDQSSNWQKLAEVPEEEFEEIINDPGMRPSGAQVLTQSRLMRNRRMTTTWNVMLQKPGLGQSVDVVNY